MPVILRIIAFALKAKFVIASAEPRSLPVGLIQADS